MRALETRLRIDLFCVVALALLTHFAYFAVSRGDFFFPDSYTYLHPAENMLHGLGFVGEAGFAETLRTPGYPLFLVPFLAASHSSTTIVVTQHLLDIALAAAIYLFARRRSGDGRIALLAGLLFAFDVPSIHNANKVLSETLFTCVLFGCLLLALDLTTRPSSGRALTLGFSIGALVLIRPVAIAWFCVVALFLAITLRQSRLRTIAIVVLASLVLPIGWGMRNQRRTGVFTIASISGTNLLLHRAAGALAIEEGADFKADLAHFQDTLLAEARQEIVEGERVDSFDEVPHAVQSRYYARLAKRILPQHPRGAAILTLRGLLVNLFQSDWAAIAIVSPIEDSILQLALDAWTVALCVFAVIGFRSLRRSDPPLALLLFLTIGYFLLISAGSEAEARFRVPVVPLCSIASAYGLQVTRRAIRPETTSALP